MPAIGFGVTNSTLQTVEVTVVPEIIKATSIEFTNEDADGNPLTELYQMDDVQLTYNILPENHTYSYLTWKSSDEGIATVDENGKVTGVEPGNVTIYAYTHDDSGVIGKIDLKILPYIPVEDITIRPYDDMLYMDEVITLDYTFTPESATASTVEWTSSDDKIVTVKLPQQALEQLLLRQDVLRMINRLQLRLLLRQEHGSGINVITLRTGKLVRLIQVLSFRMVRWQ